MADTTYKINIETAQATRALDGLKSALGGLTGAFASAFAVDKIVKVSAQFENLRTTLGILYKDTAAGAQAFDRIKGLAATTVFEVDTLTTAFIKLKTSGIEPTDAQLKLFADVASVATDSVGALQAITDLYARTTAGGLGLEDLNRLADRGIPVFNILARTMGLSRLEVSKFGQSADGAQKILKVLEVELGKTFGGASAARANTLSQAMSNLSDSVKNLIDRFAQAGPGNALTQALQDIAKFLNGINVQQINTLVENFKNLILIGGGLLIFSKGTEFIMKFIQTLNLAGAAAKTSGGFIGGLTAVTQGAGGVFGTLSDSFTKITSIAKNFTFSLGGIGKALATLLSAIFPVARILAIAYGAFELLDSAITLLTGKDLAGWWNTLRVAMDRWLTDTFPTVSSALEKLREFFGLGPGPLIAETNRLKQANMDALRAAEKRMEGQKKADDPTPVKEHNFALDRLRVTYAMLGIEAGRFTKNLRERMAFEAGIIGMSEEQVEIETKLREEAERYQRRIEELQDKQIQLRTAMIGEKDTNKLQEYQTEIALITKLILDTSDAHLRNRTEIEKGVGAIQGARLLEQDRKNILEGITRQMERQQEIQNKIRDINQTINNQLEEATYKRDRLPGLAGQITDIQRANRLAAESAARDLASLFETTDELGPSPQEMDLFVSGLNRIAEGYGELNRIQIEQLEYSRTWASGWDEAFEKFRENAYNVADDAKNYFETFTRGFESAIMRFVQTGKLSFKDLFKTLAAEILKVQANRMLANFLGASGVGGLFRNLFGGGATSTPSAVLGLPGFARGGYLPSGQMGIVGEQGPELITGPANISPMNMPQPVTVNYNIQAVDASSFRALVARDPEFIYNITEQGRRSSPTRRLT